MNKLGHRSITEAVQSRVQKRASTFKRTCEIALSREDISVLLLINLKCICNTEP